MISPESWTFAVIDDFQVNIYHISKVLKYFHIADIFPGMTFLKTAVRIEVGEGISQTCARDRREEDGKGFLRQPGCSVALQSLFTFCSRHWGHSHD